MLRFRISPLLNDIATTTLTSVITITSLIFVTRFLAKGLGPEEFGAYSLARRAIANIIPFSTLSIGVSLARYTALSGENRQRGAYLIASLYIVIGTTFVLMLSGIFLDNVLTSLIFHDSSYLTLLYASFIMLVGYSLYAILYAFYRGTQKMTQANLWQLCIVAIFPLIISYSFASDGNATLMVLLMSSSFFVSVFPLISILKRIKWAGLSQINDSARELIQYGVPRTPGGIAFAGLLTMGPFLAPYFGSLKEAGYFVVGQSVFRITESSVVAFGLIALPRIARIFSEGKENFLSRRIGDMLTLVFHLGLFITIQIYIWAKLLVLVWLGPDYTDAVPIMRILVISLSPYLAYVMLRSVIDAVEIKAVNTWNILLALGVGGALALALAYLGMGVKGIAVGSMIGFFILGGLTVSYLWRRFGFEFKKTLPGRILLANGLILLITWAVRKWWLEGEPGLIAIEKLFLVETVLLCGYIALLRYWKVGWIEEIKIRLRIAEM